MIYEVARRVFHEDSAATQRDVLAALGQPAGRLFAEASACAFALADHPHTHRNRRAESALVTSVQEAYGNASLVCQMWQVFRRKAAKAGYAPYGGVKC